MHHSTTSSRFTNVPAVSSVPQGPKRRLRRILGFGAAALIGSLLWGGGVSAQNIIDFSGNLGPAGSTFDRPNDNGLLPPTTTSGGAFFYNVVPFSLQSSSTITGETTAASLTGGSTDTYLILYQNAFDPANPLNNALIADDDTAGIGLFSRISSTLPGGAPFLWVVSTFGVGSSGTFTLRMTTASDLALSGNLQGDLTKMGRGALFLNGTLTGNLWNQAGTISPGNSPGTFHVGKNYTQSSAATLRMEFAGRKAGQFDVLQVGGRANLDGTLQLVRLNNFNFKRGDKFTILTAGQGVEGEFSEVISPYPDDTILNPEVVYKDNSVVVEVPTFTQLAAEMNLTPNQRAVATALDSTVHDSRADKLNSYLDSQKLDDLPWDFDRIAPEELTSLFAISTSLATVQSTNLQRRTDDIRHGASGFSAAGLAMQGTGPGYSGSLLGVAGPTGKETKEMKTVIPEEKRFGAFLTGVGEWVDVDGDGNARGYDISTGGFTLGLDYKFTPNFAAGISLGYVGTKADLTGDGAVWVNGGKVGLYATYFTGGFYMDAAVGGGYNSYDTKRSALQGTARGETDGSELNVFVGAGYDWKIGALTIGPTATFQYNYVDMVGFTEHGSLAPLNIGGGSVESIRSAFGFKASYDWKVGGVIVRPELRAAWQHEYGDSSYGIEASFANGAGNTFLVNGPGIGRDSVLLGAGVAIQCSERCSTYFYYDGQLGAKNYLSTAVSGGVRIAF